jgi:phosphatidylserine/phosphatidylglycerophosphate/cardiolipin synthase-like enzyme
MASRPDLKVRLVLDIHRPQVDTTQASLLAHRFADRFKNAQWPKDRPLPEVFYDPRSLDISASEKSAMHAKCIVVDNRDLFISSANFTEAAQNRNIEVGILVRSPSLAHGLVEHFDALIAERFLLQLVIGGD